MDSLKMIRDMCESIGIAKGKQSNEFLFTLECVDLFFYKKNIGAVDIKTGFVDGAGDGGIDFIYSDDEKMYLIQGKSTESLSYEEIMNVFYKMMDTVDDFHTKNYEKYSRILKQTFLNTYDDLNEEKNIELVLFTNTEISDTVYNQINKKINQDDGNNRFANFDVRIIDINKIEEKKAILFQESDLIKEDRIDLYKNKTNKNNILSYGEDGIIINVKATSVKRLYEKYSNIGLFSYNLREHITQKNVDEGIDETIQKDRDNFWFYNNGITIGCNDFYVDGNNVKLYDFSIINGAQTTTNIGKSKYVNDNNDFALVCKIVRAKNDVKQDTSFIGKISEASNSQKPIKQRDLKSNAIEQKRLQRSCAQNKYPLCVEIKRGVKAPNYYKVESWQRVKNEYLGQLIYSCIQQHPSLARNNKNSIYSSKKLYQSLFIRKHDCDTLYDLVRLGYIYDSYLTDLIAKTTDLDVIGIAKNGKLTVLAVVSYLCKKERGILNDCSSPALSEDNLNGLLITDYPYDDLYKKLNSLFEFILRQLKSIYNVNKETMKITSFSNFFKSETIYEIILENFDNLDDWDKEKLNSYMEVFTKKNK